MRPIETCSFRADHARKERTSLLASSAASATPSLAAALISASAAVRCAATLELVRAPSIPLVLGCHLLEWLLHGECDLLDGMCLRDGMGLGD